MTNDKELQLTDLAAWARAKMQGPPDFTVGDNYLRRWFVAPRNDFANIYIHEMRSDDDDRALHDHPYDNSSLILTGGYREISTGGVTFDRKPGDYVARQARELHRLELFRDESGIVIPCVSLFMTGPRYREWGFQCPKGWVPWQEFVDPSNPGVAGSGCGD